MSAAAGELVGRGQELAVLDRVLDAVAAGGPGFLAVVGEPGIGKTIVMERLSELASGRDWLVLAGRAAEFERELPFGALVDALDDYLATLDQRRLERGGERMAELAAIFPSLDGPAVPDGALQTERYRAHRAVAEWAARGLPPAAELGLGLPTAQAARADAAAKLAAGDAAGALASARAATAAAEPIGARRDAAHALLLAGRALAAQGDTEAATRELAAAEAALDTAGALRRREEAAQELRRLGHRVARRPRPARAPAGAGLEQLTEREREISGLVCERHTNRQIAAELFLSEKTVESHLRNIFAKLGVASRVEVARAVERGRG